MKVNSSEHSEIIEYQLLKNMHKVAALVKRSSGTVDNHIVNHNREVRSFGTCSKCKRVNHEHQEQIIAYV
jgi:ribosomal protein L36